MHGRAETRPRGRQRGRADAGQTVRCWSELGEILPELQHFTVDTGSNWIKVKIRHVDHKSAVLLMNIACLHFSVKMMLGALVASLQVEEIFKEIDADGSGEIEFDEFLVHFHRLKH